MVTIEINLPLVDMQVWGSLYRCLKHDRRFFLPPTERRFVEGILKFAEKHRTTAIVAGTRLFRARLNTSQGLVAGPRLTPRQLYSPPKELVRGGRLNPAGIPYLYLAEEEKTALAEVRPWQGAAVTIGRVKVLMNLRIADVTRDSSSSVPYNTHAEKGADFTSRELISYMFSIPYQPEDTISYAPTQYLAEAFRHHGFDGIRYDSALNASGRNVVLFDSAAAKVTSTVQVIVAGIDYRYSSIATQRRTTRRTK